MDREVQIKRNQEWAESKFTQVLAGLHIYGLGYAVYKSLVHRGRPMLHSFFESGILGEVLYLVTLSFILYHSLMVIRDNGRKEYSLKPVPLLLLTGQAGVIFSYLACLIAFD